MWRRPCSGRTSARSYSGEPTAASSTASAPGTPRASPAATDCRTRGCRARRTGAPRSRARVAAPRARGSPRASLRGRSRHPEPRHTTGSVSLGDYAGLHRNDPHARHRTAARFAPEEVDREFRMLIDGAWVGAESGETFRASTRIPRRLGARAGGRPGRRRTARSAPPGARSTRAAGRRRRRRRAPRCCAGSPS